MSLFSELKRRNVFRVAVAYIVAAWLIIQVAETIFPLFGFGDTPARIVVILLGIGFPLFLIFSWVFEITPEGLMLEKDVQRGKSISPKTGKKLDWIIIVMLALGLAYFAVDKFIFQPARDAALVEETARKARSDALVGSYDDKSIAVLPFVNISDDAGNEYFSDGITEELLNLLAGIPELRVTARTSSFYFKGRETTMAEIAEVLNVGHVLEGSVRKAGNRVRITAQLIEARTDTHIWSRTFDRTLDDIFAVQDEIAGRVVEQLRGELLGDPPRIRQTDPEAYALTLQARYLADRGSVESLEQAADLYRQALEIDPEYAEAWSGLGVAYVNRSPHLHDQARDAWEKALSLDPGHARSHSRLSWLSRYRDNDLESATHRMQQALKLDPADPLVLGNACSLLFSLDRVGDAIALSEILRLRDPLNPILYESAGSYYFSTGRWEEAIESYRSALRLSPDITFSHFGLGMALLYAGDAQGALAAMLEEPYEPVRLYGLALVQNALGLSAESDATFAELIGKHGESPYGALYVASVHAYRGEADAAFEWLERQAESPVLENLSGYPVLKKLHEDPRWLPYLERLGRSPEQLAAIAFELPPPK